MSGEINSTGPGGGLDAPGAAEATPGNPTPVPSRSAAVKSGWTKTGWPDDAAEAIADLRASLAERDAELRWLRAELRKSDELRRAAGRVRRAWRALFGGPAIDNRPPEVPEGSIVPRPNPFLDAIGSPDGAERLRKWLIEESKKDPG